MRIVVGSTALKYHGLGYREPRDKDLWVSYNVFDTFDAKEDTHTLPTEIMKLVPVTDGYATPDAIYTIKCSHAAWDIKWNKTIQDIMYLKAKGCRLIPDLYWKLYEHWKTVHGGKEFLSLKKNKDDFFDDYVPHKFDHDWLHSVVAIPNPPMYTKCLKDGEEVLVDHVKFLTLTFEEQVRLFREEIKVIALERYLIPSDFRIGQYKAYLMALKKTITNLTKNWATLFILDNLSEFCIMGDTKWYTNFLDLNKEYLSMSKYVAKENPLIKDILNKADSLSLDNYVVAAILSGNELPDGYFPELDELDYPEPYKTKEKELNDNYTANCQAFVDWLEEEYDFKPIETDNAGYGEGVGEYAWAIFSLGGTLYKAEYALRSYEGENYDNFFDGWKEVVKVTKTVNAYE